MHHGDDLDKIHTEPFAVAKRGSEEGVWGAYPDNLRYVLDDVSRLLANIDVERVVITSDHGELFGEWGLYSHHVGSLHPALRKVPWVETTASDTNSANPDVELSLEPTEPMEEHLEALGYR